MERGTTPTHTFNIPTDISPLIKTVKITYTQNDKEILVKRTENCTIKEGKIITKLSQEDTFLFNDKYYVYIQIRILTSDGECIKSEPMVTPVGKCLDSEVLT